MPHSPSNWLVDTDWLAANLNTLGVVVVDGSLHLPTTGRDAKVEYDAGHIPGALFFDINEISDKADPLPHMMPGPIPFASRMKKMGIGDGMRVIVYDSEGLYSAARVWWMLRVMGHDDVAILNGGLKKWRAEGREIEELPARKRAESHFTARFNGALVNDWRDVQAMIGKPGVQIVDARAAARFAGSVPEPRAGLRAGRIPSSKNVVFTDLVNADGTLKDEVSLRGVFAAAGVNIAAPIVASCGSGVTAGVIAFALAQLGRPDTAVYDGSWSEWGGRSDLPIESGPAT
jgi:thiosulfate/3-mercaptopyruvate sulfurtransferase